MKIVENKKKLDTLIREIRKKDIKIGLIPTMGSIHEGHLSLIEQSKKADCFSVASIFVNPTQFNDLEDFTKYPQSREEDIDKLNTVGCDVLYFPLTKELYPKEIKSEKTIFDFRKILCDKYRPGHFDGVTTVVKSLFDHVKPNQVFFGEKDFQQLKIINKFIEKNNLPIEIVNCPSVRLINGMSISSRYSKFSLKQKNIFNQIAIDINNCVQNLKFEINENYLNILKKKLYEYNITKIDYLEVREEVNLKLTKKKIKARLFIAFYIDKIRIIDNFILY